jgi:hypothetical protein
MKTTVNVLGAIILSILTIGILFRIQHWPGASMMLNAGFTAFAFILVPLFFIDRIRNPFSAMGTVSNIVGMIAMIFCSVGLLFKSNHWPGASLMVLGGAMILLVALVFYCIYLQQDPNKSNSEMLKTGFFGVLSVAFLSFYSVAPTADILNSYPQAYKAQGISRNVLEEITQQQLANSIDSKQKFISQKSDSLVSFIDDLKTTIIKFVDKTENKIEVQEKCQDITNIENKSNLDGGSFVLLWENGPNKGKMLKEKINQLKESMLAYVKTQTAANDTLTEKQIQNLLNTDNSFFIDQMVSWETAQFEMKPVVAQLTTLQNLQSNIRLAEFISLNAANQKNTLK